MSMPNYTLPPPPPGATRESIEAEIAAEIAQQTNPLQAAAEQAATSETRAVDQLNQMFGGLMPFVQGSAQRVGESFGASNAAQQQIFAQATQRLNALHQQRAAEAQALAQQLGAPIPTSMFTDPTDVEMAAQAPEAAGQLLHSQGIAQSGVQEAEAFAGKVFPLKRTELESGTRNFYRDKISELNKQIANIKSMAPGMINERLRTRMLEDYQMRVDRAKTEFDMWRGKAEERRLATQTKQTQVQIALEKKKAAHDWWLQRKSLKLEQRKLNAQIEEIRGGFAQAGLDRAQRGKLATMEANIKKQQTQLALKQQVLQASQTLWHGPTSKDVKKSYPKVDPLTGKVVGVQSVTETVPVPASKLNNPNRVLSRLLAASGITGPKDPLYGFAKNQVMNLFKMRGYTKIPASPKEWDKWWTQKMKESRKGQQAPPGQTKSDLGKPPQWGRRY